MRESGVSCTHSWQLGNMLVELFRLKLAIGWHIFKTPITMSKEERKRVVRQSFYGCMHENNNNIEDICQMKCFSETKRDRETIQVSCL